MLDLSPSLITHIAMVIGKWYVNRESFMVREEGRTLSISLITHVARDTSKWYVDIRYVIMRK